jgi:hypothetical protein
MPFIQFTHLPRALIGYLFILIIFAGCGGSHEESVAGVNIPIPGGMTKSGEKGVELSLPGFGGAQASYYGNMDPGRVIEFYKKEMPARGWKTSAGLVSQGGMLTYAHEGKSVVVMVGKSGSATTMTVTVGTSTQ